MTYKPTLFALLFLVGCKHQEPKPTVANFKRNYGNIPCPYGNCVVEPQATYDLLNKVKLPAGFMMVQRGEEFSVENQQDYNHDVSCTTIGSYSSCIVGENNAVTITARSNK